MATTLAVACSGGDDSASTTVTPPPTLGVGSLVAAATTAPAPPEPTPAEPSFEPAAVVAASSARPWLLVGTARAQAGEASRAALYTSTDGSSWARLAFDAPASSTADAAVATADGGALVAGSIDSADGVRPVVWAVTAAGVGPPVDVATTGRPRAVAATPAGAAVLLVVGPDGAAVVVGPVVTPLVGAADVVGVAASATTIVVTGSTTWRSIDGGRTFEQIPTAPSLGAVTGTPGGFLAASCLTGGVVISPDGRTWTDLPGVHPRGVVPQPGACDAIGADPDGGAWLAATVGGQPAVFRVREGVVDLLGVVPRPPGTLFDGAALVAAGSGVLVAAVPQPGGVAVARADAVTLTTGLELDAAMAASTGAPIGHAAPAGVVPLDDRGRVAGILTYPLVTDDLDGSYRWTTSVAAARLSAAGELAPDLAAAPVGPDGSLGGIVTTPSEQVALSTVAERQPGATAVGDVVVSRRSVSRASPRASEPTHSDGPWSARRVVVGGPGRQAVVAVVAVGDDVVGVGEERRVDATTGAEQVTPLVLLGDGTTFERVPLDAPAAISLAAACAGPSGTVVALGTDTASGAGVLVTIDPAAPTATVRPAPTAAAPIGCATVGGEVVVASAGELVVLAADGTPTSLALLRPGDDVSAVASGPSGVAVTGSTVTGDGFVLAGPAPAALTPLDVPALTGIGTHEPTGLVVRSDRIVVLGLADGAPAAWTVDIG